MKKHFEAFFISCLLVLTGSSVTVTDAQAHSQAKRRKQVSTPPVYYLPKAGFPVLTGGSDNAGTGGASGGELPQVNGLHLQEGIDRRSGDGGQAYDPGEPELTIQGGVHPTVRWSQQRFPLRVWISDGKQLPEVPFLSTKDDRPTRVHNMLKNPAGFDALPVCSGWKPEMNDAVASGIEEWREMSNEGVIKFGFVERPENADIMVFFTTKFPGASGPGGTDVKAMTISKDYTPQDVQNFVSQGLDRVPTVMEFVVNEDANRLQGDAAHEFGHALGIKAHSPYRQDIMYENRIVDLPSPADKATLRALYKRNTNYWFY